MNKDVVYKHNVLFVIKRNEIFPFVTTWMDAQKVIMLGGISQIEKQMPYDFAYMWNLKTKKEKKQTKHQKQTHRYRDKNDGSQAGAGGRECCLLIRPNPNR